MTDDEFNENLRGVCRTLLAWRGRTIEEMAAGIGVSRSCAYQRLGPFTVRGRPMQPTEFTAREMWRLARFFGVHVSVLFRPVSELIAGADDHSAAPAIRS